MKTYECIAHSGNTGNEIVIFVRAVTESNARMEALEEAKQRFGSGAGAVTIKSARVI